MERNTRNTKQRRVIFEELTRLGTHPTAAELHAVVRRRLPRISLGTVYRNLDVLVRLGQAKKLTGGSGQARYDADLDHHHHLRCLACGRVFDIELPAPEVAELFHKQVGARDQGEIVGLTLEFTGICRGCCRRLSKAERERIARRESPSCAFDRPRS